MKYFITILIAVFIIYSVLIMGEEPGKIIINGKVLNFAPGNNQIRLVLGRLAFPPEEVDVNLDKTGCFYSTFNINIPSDVYIDCGNAFYLLVHPGDSINVVFDYKSKDFLDSIKFSGSAVKTNEDAAAFQNLYSFKSLYSDFNTYQKTIKENGTTGYRHYLDSCRLEWNKLYQRFIDDKQPNQETRIWISTYLENEFYYNYSFYPVMHRQFNNLRDKEWDVPEGYYNKLKEITPIRASMTICSNAMHSLINCYHYFYAFKNTIEENKKIIEDTNRTNLEKDICVLKGLIKFTPDSLLRQMVITEMVAEKLGHSDIELFEKENELIDEYVKEPYLREPLYSLYKKVKEELNNPKLASDVVLKKLEGSSVAQIMDSILTTNQGEVIYLDCWATWCTPCLNELPKSKNLRKELTNKDIAFIYLCVDSNVEIWKATISKLQLGGQQYYLDKNQSTDFRHIFEVEGVPFYILIDKKGNIIEKGTHLRPDEVKNKILELL